MREILFRGKRVDNGEWVEGYLLCYYGYTTIITKDDCAFGYTSNYSYDGGVTEVIPETVGQYTGLCDRNGKKIFEGDIVYYASEEEYGQITYSENEAMFMAEFDGWCTDFDHLYGKALDVVGNIHDNPELFKGGAVCRHNKRKV